ncbi:MAG: beta-phosphoglucomutase family hydrolase [Nitrospirales bacterium]
MSQSSTTRITADKFDAVLFDLDGVVTATAKMHAACWKKMFDEYLQKRGADSGKPVQLFDIVTDYRLHVDGKLRFDGVRDFLESRSIKLPEGTPDDPPGRETVCGLGNWKNTMINEVIESTGVEVYEGTVALIKQVREQGLKTAIVTSSQNREAVLRAARIGDLFDAAIDGNVIAEQGLAGKPAPDSFLKAAEVLGVDPKRAVVVEDAISGVRAGRDGGFGLVIGVARKGEVEELKDNGADLVVTDLSELL